MAATPWPGTRCEDGPRQQVNFVKDPCRLHTYGNSFTQGHQVSDGETWQEVLAAHFCEPVKNFGIGGFGVYQAFRRLKRIESTDRGAPWLVFNIWGDDHLRSVMAWRWLVFPPEVAKGMGRLMFHSNPWCHARLSPEDGRLEERDNPCPTPGDVLRLSDPDYVVETFSGDEVVQLQSAARTGEVVDREVLERVISSLGESKPPIDLSSPEKTRATADTLLHTYAVRVGMRIMEKLEQFAASAARSCLSC